MEIENQKLPKYSQTLDSIQLENLPCPLGCEENDELLFSGHDKLHDLPGEFNIVKCCNCSLIRTNPRPTPVSMAFYYPEDYGPYIDTMIKETELEKASKLKAVLKPLVRSIFDTKEKALPPLKAGKLLEVGCASGSFLRYMENMGWEVSGIEYSPKAAQKAQELGYKVHVGTLESAPVFSEKFDLLVGWMVLEHLHDPIVALTKLNQMANPDTWLVLSMPNAGSREFQLFNSNWYALQPPNHLHHFTPDSLAKVLEKSGWSLIKVYHQRNLSNLYRSLAYCCEAHGWHGAAKWLRKLTSPPGIFFYLLFPISRLFATFGQTGRMTIWAQPNNDVLVNQHSSSI